MYQVVLFGLQRYLWSLVLASAVAAAGGLPLFLFEKPPSISRMRGRGDGKDIVKHYKVCRVIF